MGVQGFFYLLILAVLLIVPFWRLLPRYGISKFYSLFAVLPAIALILLWIIAFKDDLDGKDNA